MAGVVFLTGCGPGEKEKTVVVYTAHDQIYSEPVFDQFTKSTGIPVKAAYDTEATKTVGLANRLMAESAHPVCDVFWNNEILRTIMLKRQGCLTPYVSPSAMDIPDAMKDHEGYWTGFAARARVLIINTNLVKPDGYPQAMSDLSQARFRRRIAMAYPLFGTTATHAAALFVQWGEEPARQFFRDLKSNEVAILDGNAAVRDAVARGEIPMGLTDTDDAFSAVQQGQPVIMHFLDQGPGQGGALVIPNTIGLIKGAPHSQAAQRFIDHLASRETERQLAFSGSGQMPVREDIPSPSGAPSLKAIKAMPVDWEKVADHLPAVTRFLSELFQR